jgi:hypothetical protein
LIRPRRQPQVEAPQNAPERCRIEQRAGGLQAWAHSPEAVAFCWQEADSPSRNAIQGKILPQTLPGIDFGTPDAFLFRRRRFPAGDTQFSTYSPPRIQGGASD